MLSVNFIERKRKKIYVYTVRQFVERTYEILEKKKKQYFWKFDKLSAFSFYLMIFYSQAFSQYWTRWQMERLLYFMNNKNSFSFKLLPHLRNLILSTYRFFYRFNIYVLWRSYTIVFGILLNDSMEEIDISIDAV